jgi:hypothetical protein
MLGEVVAEGSGQIIGMRILPPDGGHLRTEVTFQGRAGKLLGHEVSDLGTYCQTVRPGGFYYGEGRVILMTTEGDIAEWSGFGVGRPTGPAPAGHFAPCGSIQTTSERLARLNGISTVGEYEVDVNGHYQWRLYEWVPASLHVFASCR